MRKTFLMCVLLAPFVHAQTVECPRVSQGAKLTGAGAYFDKQTEIQGARKEVKGGFDIELPLNTAWLVCEYGAAQKWEEVKPDPKIKSCTLRVRETKKEVEDIKLTCK
jgi:hypothetical protein